MIIAPMPPDEEERLQAIYEMDILDTMPEKEYDNLTRIAAKICEVPISLITLLDKDRNYFKSHYGTELTESPREYAFCTHAILRPDKLMVVEDAGKDERFHDNPVVAGPPQLRFYAGMPIVTREGYPFGTICVYDIKPNRLNEVQIELLETLANQISKLVELRRNINELKKHERQLEANNDELSHLAYLLSHDIRSPLNSLASLLKILQDEFGDQLEAEGQEVLTLSAGSTEKLNDLVTGILDYFKTTRRLRSGKSEVDLNHLLKKTADLCSPPAEATISYPPGLPVIEAPLFVLEQVLLNLVTNAIKHNHCERPLVEISFSQNDKSYQFQVTDNGPGIPVELRPKLFKLFETVGKPNRFGKESTGIGLAIVKKLLNEAGGTVEVADAEGGGSAFIFNLPK